MIPTIALLLFYFNSVLCDVMGAFYQYIYFPSLASQGMISRCSYCTVTVNAAHCTNNIGETGYWEEYIGNEKSSSEESKNYGICIRLWILIYIKDLLCAIMLSYTYSLTLTA